MTKPSLTVLLALMLAGVSAAGDDDKPLPPKHKARYASAYYHSFKDDRERGPEFHWHGLLILKIVSRSSRPVCLHHFTERSSRQSRPGTGHRHQYGCPG